MYPVTRQTPTLRVHDREPVLSLSFHTFVATPAMRASNCEPAFRVSYPQYAHCCPGQWMTAVSKGSCLSRHARVPSRPWRVSVLTSSTLIYRFPRLTTFAQAHEAKPVANTFRATTSLRWPQGAIVIAILLSVPFRKLPLCPHCGFAIANPF